MNQSPLLVVYVHQKPRSNRDFRRRHVLRKLAERLAERGADADTDEFDAETQVTESVEQADATKKVLFR
jgi:hypothetical protein